MTRASAILTFVPALVMGLAAIAATPHAMTGEKRMERTITVSASGVVSAEPDVARITLGVVAEGETAREALTRNTDAMQKVIAAIKARGVDPKDIATSSFNVQPRYTSPRDGQPQVIKGYRVSNEVLVTVRELARLGEILDALVTVGANEISGLAFEVSKADLLKDEARKLAMANAQRRAQLLAQAAGAEVGEVVTIAEDTSDISPRPAGFARATLAKAVPIEKGSQELEARVTVTWALK